MEGLRASLNASFSNTPLVHYIRREIDLLLRFKFHQKNSRFYPNIILKYLKLIFKYKLYSPQVYFTARNAANPLQSTVPPTEEEYRIGGLRCTYWGYMPQAGSALCVRALAIYRAVRYTDRDIIFGTSILGLGIRIRSSESL